MSDLTDEQLESMVKVGDRGALMAQAASELLAARATIKRLETIRAEWAKDGVRDREWLGAAFFDDLDRAIKGGV